MSDITEPTIEKLKRMWMSQPFAGPTEKWDAEANFDAMVTVTPLSEKHPLSCSIWTHNGGGACDCQGEPKSSKPFIEHYREQGMNVYSVTADVPANDENDQQHTPDMDQR